MSNTKQVNLQTGGQKIST